MGHCGDFLEVYIRSFILSLQAFAKKGEFSFSNDSKSERWKTIQKCYFGGSLGGVAVWRLPLAQGAILETRDRIPRQAPGTWSLLLPLPMSLPLSLCVCV